MLLGGVALRCFVCDYVYSIPDSIDQGEIGCGDVYWNLTDEDTDYIREDLCAECFKVLTWLGRE